MTMDTSIPQMALPFDFTPWIPPFTYDPHGTRVVDSQERLIVDIRGWGFLTGKGSEALGMNEEKACVLQDALGRHVASLLNASSDPEQPKSANAVEASSPNPSSSSSEANAKGTMEDTARLDWLDAQRDPVSIDGETLLAYVWTIEAQNYAIRDAIDAEMASSQTPPSPPLPAKGEADQHFGEPGGRG